MITIRLGNKAIDTYHEFKLTPEDYMEKRGFYCELKLYKSLNTSPESQYWVLGASFLKKYYTVFDLDTNMIGFARSTYVSKPSWMIQIKYFIPRIVFVLSFSYIIFEVFILSLLERYLPDSAITRKLQLLMKS